MKIVICDDKEEILNELRKILIKICNCATEITTTRMPDSLLQEWKQHPTQVADILLMDIEYPYLKQRGIAIAKELKEAYPNIKIIFITGKIDYAQDIFVTEPSSFLVKPVSEGRLKIAIEKAAEQIAREREEIVSIRSRGGVVKIPASTIMYIESIGHNMVIHSEKRDETFRMKLTDCLNLLPDDFLMIHQSYIVHAKYVRKMQKDGIALVNGLVLPVSRSRYQEIKDKFFDEIEKNY